MSKKLYYWDNLDVLSTHIDDDSIDLIYLDPPFNSNRDYNANFSKSAGENDTAQMMAFEDSWSRNQQSEEMLNYMRSDDMIAYMPVSKMLDMFVEMLDRNDTAAYLTMMTPRLCLMHGKLKDTWSIYLHCDPTASHYVKIIMDKIFGKRNFRNEIVRSYRTGWSSTNFWSKKHDVILFYSISDKYFFNNQKEKSYTKSKSRKPWIVNYWKWDAEFFEDDKGVYNIVNARDVREIPYINSQSKERLWYPTQKPIALLERILKASCPVDGVVLDPFCGCGTTLAAAESLNKSSEYHISRIGIDLTPLAINVIEKRLEEVYGLQSGKDFTVVGDPVDYAGAIKLAKEVDKYHFENWVMRLLNCIPSKYKVVGWKVVPLKWWDGGFDGFARFGIKDGDNKWLMIAEVKSGKVGRRDIDIFVQAMTRQWADIGVFVVLEKANMAKDGYAEASKQWFYDYKWFQIPKIQIWNIEDHFSGKKPLLPFGMAGHIIGKKTSGSTKEEETLF